MASYSIEVDSKIVTSNNFTTDPMINLLISL